MVDARGLLCPMPVVLVQKEIQKSKPDRLEVLVDDPCAVGNITRFGNSKGYQVTSEKLDGEFRLTLKK